MTNCSNEYFGLSPVATGSSSGCVSAPALGAAAGRAVPASRRRGPSSPGRTRTTASGPSTATALACRTRAKRSATHARSSRGASTITCEPSTSTRRSGASQISYMSAGTRSRSSPSMRLQVWSGSSVTDRNEPPSRGKAPGETMRRGPPERPERRLYRGGRGRSGDPGGAGRKSRGIPPAALCTCLCRACRRACADDRHARLGPPSPTPPARHEAHLPAQEAQARPYARVPRSHAHARRSPDPQAPPREGSSAAQRLTVEEHPRPTAPRGRPKRGRLSRSAEFERVYRQGRSVGNRFLVLYAFPRAGARGSEGPRLGLSVSRKVGGAVDRNRVKRLLREAFAVEGERVPADHDVVLVARPEARDLAAREGLEGIRRALGELVGRALAEGSRP